MLRSPRILLCLLTLLWLPGTAAQAMTMKACGAAYQEARAGGTLGGLSWTEFRKARCLDDTATKPASGATASPEAEPAAPVAGAKEAVFPAGVAKEHLTETPGKARRRTCLDQYRANKATGGNAGLKWQQKGGGYYSACNRRLKGASG